MKASKVSCCFAQQCKKSKTHWKPQKTTISSQRCLRLLPELSNSATFSGAFVRCSAGSQVASQGLYPFQLTKYSTRLRLSLFAVMDSTSYSSSAVSGRKTGERRSGGAPSWRLRTETWCTSCMPRKSAGSCSRKLTGDTCATTRKGLHQCGANLRDN